jgi:hypothetical protein
MRSRFAIFVAALAATVLALVARPAAAAPEAKILRIDPRAGQTDGTPILTTVVELGQRKRMSEATADCAYMRGDAQAECIGQRLAQPGAMFTPFDFPPKENVLFTVMVDGQDQPAKFVDKHKWGEAQAIAGVGTAWLIVIDAAGSMGREFGEAQQVAAAFVNAMGPQDIADIMVIGNGPVLSDSKWKGAAQKAELLAAITGARELPPEGRARPLFTIIKNAATDAFKDLGNAGTNVAVPLHQAMVVLSNGSAGADALTNGAGATQLSAYLTKGRFPEDNTSVPKSPLPVISILFPTRGLSEEFTKNAGDFMTNLANTDIGGFFGVVKSGGAAQGQAIVNTVRARFNQMWVVRWRVSCVASTVLQSFNLIFRDTNPPIAPDGSFKDVPIGIDPSTWPLDVDVAYSRQIAQRDPVHPGGNFKVFGNFCWGSNPQRAQVYFVPKNQAPPAATGHDIEAAKRAQAQLIAMKMDGKAIKVTDTSVEFEAPDNDNILVGKGDQAVTRLVIYDSGARRMSGATATTILQLKGSEKPLPIVWIVAAAFGGVVVVLLIIAIARGGSGPKRKGGAPPPAPGPGPGPGGPPGGWQPPGGGPPPGYGGPPGAPPGGGYGGPPGGGYGGPPGGYRAEAGTPPPPVAAPPMGPSPAPHGTAVLGQVGTPAPAAASMDFLYGGKPPQYGLTTGQPQMGAPPPNPYEAPGSASRATLSGAAGVFTVLPGSELRVGRDAAQCQIVLGEPRVSAVHGAVKLESGQLLVRDDGSNNGTHVNGTRLQPRVWMPVPPGSMVRFGPVELSVRLE